MKLLGFIFLLVFGAIAAISVIVYMTYEKPAQEIEIQYNTINLKTFTAEDSKQLKIGYEIVLNSSIYKTGTTTESAYLRDHIPTNNSFIIYNKNLEGQHYYTTFVEKIDNGLGEKIDYRIDMPIYEPGQIVIQEDSLFRLDNPYYLFTKVSGKITNIAFCVRWSNNIISVYPTNEEFLEMTVPSRLYNKVDKCYETFKTVQDDSLVLGLNYRKFGTLTSKDYIELYILDGDIQDFTTKEVIYEDLFGKDLGKEDLKYIIK